MENSEKQPPGAEESEPFNGIKGFENLDLLKAPETPPEGTLSPKVRQSIERKILNRQKKIEAHFNQLSTLSATEQFREQFGLQLGRVSVLLAEQADIVRKESLGNIDFSSFQKKVKQIEDLQRVLTRRMHEGITVDVAEEMRNIKNIIFPQPSRQEVSIPADAHSGPVAPQTEVRQDTSTFEELSEKTIAAAMKEPEVMGKVAERVTKERKNPEVKSETALEKDDGTDLIQRIIADVERSGIIERKRGTRNIERSGRQVAYDIRKLVRILKSEEFNAKPAAEREQTIQESIRTLTIDKRLQRDLQSAFQQMGFLTELTPVRREPLQGKEIHKRSSAAENTGIFRRSAFRAAIEERGEDFMAIKRRIASVRRTGVASAVAGAAAPPPAPTAQPQAPRTPEEAGMIGTGWREDRAAPAVGVPARRESRTGGIASLGGGSEPLHARAEVTTESLENPAFTRYLEQINKRGVFTGLGRPEVLELLKNAFECRRAVAQGIIEFYSSQQIAGDLGAPFGKEEIEPVISARIEKLSLEQPERVVVLNELFTSSRDLPRQIAELEARKQKLASGEELQEATARMGEKKKALEQAKVINRFLPKLKFWEDATGWGRLAVFHPEGRKTLKEAHKYGVAASVMLGGGSFVYEGKIGKELKTIDADINRISDEKAGDLAVTEQLLQNAKSRLHALKMEILGTGAVHEETAEIVRHGIREAFRKMLNPAEPSVEGYEAAEETLANLERVASSKDPGVLRMDYLRYVNPAEARAAFQQKAESEAAKALRTLFFRILENPRAPERLPTLIAALEPWLGREKIGSKKNKLAAGLFVLEQIKNFHDAEIISKDAELQNLRALVESGMARPEDVARLREKETPLQMKDALLRELHEHLRAVISAREKRTSQAAPSSGVTPIIRSIPYVSSSEIPPIIPITKAETPVSGRETAPSAAEKIPISTFQDILNLPKANLSRVLKLTTMDNVSAALSFATPAEVEKVRSCLFYDDVVRFDRLQGLGILNSEATVEQAQKEIMEIVRKALEEKTQ